VWLWFISPPRTGVGLSSTTDGWEIRIITYLMGTGQSVEFSQRENQPGPGVQSGTLYKAVELGQRLRRIDSASVLKSYPNPPSISQILWQLSGNTVKISIPFSLTQIFRLNQNLPNFRINRMTWFNLNMRNVGVEAKAALPLS